MNNKYCFSEFVSNIFDLAITKVFYNKARLIRRPFYIRGKKSIKYGKGLTTGHGCRFDLEGTRKTLIIGENCQLGDYNHIVAHEKVEIGNNVLIASKVFISDTNHGNYKGNNQSSPNEEPNKRKLCMKPVKIGNNVWIGDNVCILSGVSVGDGVIIGANSVVNKDVPSNTIVVGAPARVVKKYNENTGMWEKIS